ncbi:MAG: hypothetical protein QXL17_04625 [Candidatus Thermoplasmatota archaeon]
MIESVKKISTSGGGAIWIPEKKECPELIQRQETAFQAAVSKLLASSGNIELVLQTGEAFGRGLFAERLQEKPQEWTLQTWLQHTLQEIFLPLGAEFSFTKITDNEVQSHLTKSTLLSNTTETTVSSLFTYGVLRGLFLSAFPKGEVLLTSSDPDATQAPQICFKAYASYKDRFERERVKNSFLITKKL